MKIRQLALGLVVLVAASAAGRATADSPHAAQHFDTDSVDAFASTNELFIGVFAQGTQGPGGFGGFAVVNKFDLTTGEFTQCLASTFDIRINNARTVLSFLTGSGGFNCVEGQAVALTCEPTSQSGIFHNVTNGTAKIGVFGQQYTTHGVVDQYTAMACTLSVTEGQFSAMGSATSSRQTATQ